LPTDENRCTQIANASKRLGSRRQFAKIPFFLSVFIGFLSVGQFFGVCVFEYFRLLALSATPGAMFDFSAPSLWKQADGLVVFAYSKLHQDDLERFVAKPGLLSARRHFAGPYGVYSPIAFFTLFTVS
jgi:hypothetical protein